MHNPEKSTSKSNLFSQTQQPRTQMEDLRQILNRLEKAVARIPNSTPEQAMEIPVDFDRVLALMESLDQSGVNIDSQKTQFQTISGQFQTRMKTYIRQIGGKQALQQTRQFHQPKSDHWWWFVDDIIASESRTKISSRLRNLAIIVFILVIAGIIYNKYFAPDPAFRASLGHQQNAENSLILGDYDIALTETNAALVYSPESAELLVLKGVIQDQLGQPEEAEKSYTKAKEYLDQEDLFYVQRALYYLIMEMPELVLTDCDIALELNPDSAVCYMQQGQAYDLLGDVTNAVERLELADEAAERLGNTQLQAIIRVSLSHLLQRIPETTTPEVGK